MSFLHRIARSPYLLLSSGLVLIVTSLIEIFDEITDPPVGIHHGILLLGVVQIIHALPHVLHGAADLDEGAETLAEEGDEDFGTRG